MDVSQLTLGCMTVSNPRWDTLNHKQYLNLKKKYQMSTEVNKNRKYTVDEVITMVKKVSEEDKTKIYQKVASISTALKNKHL